MNSLNLPFCSRGFGSRASHQCTYMNGLQPLLPTSLTCGKYVKLKIIKRGNCCNWAKTLVGSEKKFFKCTNPGLFFIYFCLFKHTLQNLQKIRM